MKLELKHLAPYLPYELQMAYIVKDEVVEVGSLNKVYINKLENHPIRYGINYNDAEHEWMFKPLLRPLSSITKEEASKLLSKVQGVSINEDTLRVFNNNNNTIIIQYEYPNDYLWCLSLSYTKALIATPYTIYGSHKRITPTPMFIYDWFIKNHFDVFGLIEKGLAIDKTTFK